MTLTPEQQRQLYTASIKFLSSVRGEITEVAVDVSNPLDALRHIEKAANKFERVLKGVKP